MLMRGNETAKPYFRAAMGMSKEDYDPAFPLPNMKPATEKDYWSRFSSNSWQSDAYLGYKKFNEDIKGTVNVFFSSHTGHFADGGMVVIYDHSYLQEKVHYFTWSACDHDWHEKTVGRCLHECTCSKCGSKYTYDSGD